MLSLADDNASSANILVPGHTATVPSTISHDGLPQNDTAPPANARIHGSDSPYIVQIHSDQTGQTRSSLRSVAVLRSKHELPSNMEVGVNNVSIDDAIRLQHNDTVSRKDRLLQREQTLSREWSLRMAEAAMIRKRAAKDEYPTYSAGVKASTLYVCLLFLLSMALGGLFTGVPMLVGDLHRARFGFVLSLVQLATGVVVAAVSLFKAKALVHAMMSAFYMTSAMLLCIAGALALGLRGKGEDRIALITLKDQKESVVRTAFALEDEVDE